MNVIILTCLSIDSVKDVKSEETDGVLLSLLLLILWNLPSVTGGSVLEHRLTLSCVEDDFICPFEKWKNGLDEFQDDSLCPDLIQEGLGTVNMSP